jgi:hypothetical protein
MSKLSAEALVLLEQIAHDNYIVSIKKLRNDLYELTIFRDMGSDDHSHYNGETFIDVINTAAKAEGLI